MSDIIEISDLDLNDNKFNVSSTSRFNFGEGIELLMNDKIKDTRQNNVFFDDLENLENDLNNLVEEPQKNIQFSPKSDFFTEPSSQPTSNNVKFNDNISSTGQTSGGINNDTTWDGYSTFNNIPLNPDKLVSTTPQLTKEELLREKFKYLKKLEQLEKKGVDLSKKYNMDSSLSEMMGEYETILDEKTKQNSVKFQRNMLMAFVNGVEFLNNRFDPFDINLDGWGEQINENISDYDDIFTELHDKYKTKATIAPELKLLFQLGGSAMMVYMTNTMFKSSMPGMDDILRQNPDLMRSFQNAAVSSMSQSAPGLSGFMSSVTNSNDKNTFNNGPPPPLATQGLNSVPPSINRPGNNNYRQNLNFTNDGMSIKENVERMEFQDKSKRPQKPQNVQQQSRPEMKGPSDIMDILSGLKTKTINIQEPVSSNSNLHGSSTISLDDLKELQGDGGSMPKRGRRRPKSNSNTISLDI